MPGTEWLCPRDPRGRLRKRVVIPCVLAGLLACVIVRQIHRGSSAVASLPVPGADGGIVDGLVLEGDRKVPTASVVLHGGIDAVWPLVSDAKRLAVLYGDLVGLSITAGPDGLTIRGSLKTVFGTIPLDLKATTTVSPSERRLEWSGADRAASGRGGLVVKSLDPSTTQVSCWVDMNLPPLPPTLARAHLRDRLVARLATLRDIAAGQGGGR